MNFYKRKPIFEDNSLDIFITSGYLLLINSSVKRYLDPVILMPANILPFSL